MASQRIARGIAVRRSCAIPGPVDAVVGGRNVIESGTSGVVEIAATDYGFVTSNCGAWIGTR